MKPEERIDIVDLMNYAIKKRYIKSSCSMTMDEPLRKLSQRLLSKMFPGATICKNRNRRAYNVSFIKGKQFSGDNTNYIRDDRLITLLPENLTGLRNAAKCIAYDIPTIFLPYFFLLHEKSKLQYGYWHRSSRDEAIELFTKRRLEDIVNHPSYNLDKLRALASKLDDFNTMYSSMAEEVKHTLSPEKYGFSFNYGVELPWRMNRYYYGYNRPQAEENKTIKRRFQLGSTTIEALERLQFAFKAYKAIRGPYTQQLQFIREFKNSVFPDISRIKQGIQEDQFRTKEAMRQHFIESIGKMLDEKFHTRFFIPSSELEEASEDIEETPPELEDEPVNEPPTWEELNAR